MAFHVLGHVEADQLHAHNVGELTGHLSLTHARGPREQVRPNRLFWLAQTGPSQLDSAGYRFDGTVLTEHDGLQIAFQVSKCLPIVGGDRFRGDAGDHSDYLLHILHCDRLLAFAFRHQHA